MLQEQPPQQEMQQQEQRAGQPQHQEMPVQEKKQMIIVPEGCAHGFQVLEDDSELLYLHTAFYNSNNERSYITVKLK